MKTCTKCKDELGDKFFNKNKCKKDGLNNICKICSREKSRQYYSDNREDHIIVTGKRSKKIRERNKKFISDYLSDKNCKDCGNSDIRVFEFDHLPEFKKFKDISNMMFGGYSIDAIKEEIDKCEIVCCNCHRIRTIKRRKNISLA